MGIDFRKYGKLFSRILYGLTAAIAIIMIAMVFCKEGETTEINHGELRQMRFIGTYQTCPLEEARKLKGDKIPGLEKCDTLILKGHFDGDIEKKEQFLFYIQGVSIQIFQNGNLIYYYGGEGTHPNITRTGGSVWGSFYTSGIKTTDDIKIVIYNSYKTKQVERCESFLKNMFVGNKMKLFLNVLYQNLFKVVEGGMVFIFGVVLLVATMTLKIMGAELNNTIFSCGLLFLVCGLWLLLDSSYTSLLLPYGSALSIAETLALVGMIPLAIHYTKNFMVSRVRYVFHVIEYVYLCINLLYMCLQWNGVIDGEMMQGWFLLILPYFVVILSMGIIVDLVCNYSRKNRFMLASGLILIAFGSAGGIYEAWNQKDGEFLFGIGVCLFALTQFLIAMHYTKESFMMAKQTGQMEKELMENRISVMMSQIQPHFLYNSISCIQELCLIEPKKAYHALAQFAQFLRGNMDSLNSNQLIPFEQELCHVKNYLALEKIRFDDRLNIVYEIETEGFLIPALTIQPIVENAVRYGVSKKKSGGTVTITTREEKNEIVIIVSDDGIGFVSDPAMNTSGTKGKRSHIGLENVSKRIKSQCGGILEVNSFLEHGTVVKIRIPKGKTKMPIG